MLCFWHYILKKRGSYVYFSNQRSLTLKPKTTFWQDFLPTILLGGRWSWSRLLRGQGSECRAWRKSLRVRKSPLLPRNNCGQSPRKIWESHHTGQQDTLPRSRCATAASRAMTGNRGPKGRGPAGKRARVQCHPLPQPHAHAPARTTSVCPADGGCHNDR